MSRYDRLKFIVPDWDDIVDPKYDFTRESNSAEYRINKYKYGARIWNIYKNDPPLDGVLVSRSQIDPGGRTGGNIKRRYITMCGGIKKFFNLSSELHDPSRFQVIGDCGAWQYIDYDEPPYKVEDTLEFYNHIGVDYGVSVDHIAIYRDPEKRMKITYKNAVESFNYWRPRYEKGEFRFILLGAVQGVEVNDYIRSIEKLYRIGYRHFALGGLARRNTVFIEKLIEKLISLSRRISIEKIHFLGIARPRLASLLAKLTDYVSEVSFDNATYLRIAWSRSVGNYLSIDGNFYTAIRVRIGSVNEWEVLDALHRYDLGEISYEDVMKVLREYTSLNGDTRYLPYYARLLRDRPWRQCKCRICREIGIDVVIFRRNDRNRRRGFHNLWVFYRLLKSGDIDRVKFRILPGDKSEIAYVDVNERLRVFSSKLDLKLDDIKHVLIITSCTMEKNIDWIKVIRLLESRGLKVPEFDLEKEDVYRSVLKEFIKPAREMYLGTFRLIRKIEDVLRRNGVKVDIVIISARYGVIDADTPIIPYEATLKKLRDSEIELWAKRRNVVGKLRNILSRRNYDLIIVVLPRSYVKPVKEIIKDLLKNPRSILLLPTTKLIENVSERDVVRAVVIHTGNLRRRVEFLNLLRIYLEQLFMGQKTLDEHVS